MVQQTRLTTDLKEELRLDLWSQKHWKGQILCRMWPPETRDRHSWGWIRSSRYMDTNFRNCTLSVVLTHSVAGAVGAAGQSSAGDMLQSS